MLRPSNGHWEFDKQVGVGNQVGFVYVIEHRLRGQLYLGRKALAKGKDWRTYCGSSAAFADADPHLLTFTILDTFDTSGGLAYAETWALCYVHAPLSDLWVNTRIEPIKFKVKEYPTQKMIERLDALRSKYG